MRHFRLSRGVQEPRGVGREFGGPSLRPLWVLRCFLCPFFPLLTVRVSVACCRRGAGVPHRTCGETSRFPRVPAAPYGRGVPLSSGPGAGGGAAVEGKLPCLGGREGLNEGENGGGEPPGAVPPTGDLTLPPDNP